MMKVSSTSVWTSDLESLAAAFWVPYRNALRNDLPGAMKALHTVNLGFAQRIESMDRRQVETFARALGPVRFLNVREGTAVTQLGATPTTSAEHEGGSLPWLGAFTMQYFMLARNGLKDRRDLAIEQFGLQTDLCVRMLGDVTVGDLLTRQDAFAQESALELLVSVSMEVLADRTLNGGCAEELRMCRMAHAASVNNHNMMHMGLAA